ncbi:MAG: biotin/lipoyl-containing protein [Polyangia bacterium]
MIRRYVIEVAGTEHEVAVEALSDGRWRVERDGRSVEWDARKIAGTWSLVPGGGGPKHEVEVERLGNDGGLTVTTGGLVGIPARVVDPLLRAAEKAAATRPAGPADVKSPMPGKVVRALVAVGATVTAGQPVMVVEAMKMENELKAPRDGSVKEIRVTDGQAIEAGQTLIVLV